MSKRSPFNLRQRVRQRLSGLKRQRSPNIKKTSSPNDTPTTEKNDVTAWSKTSAFRSKLSFNGSTKVKIWFETVDETGVRFTLDLKSGTVSNRENWTTEIQMPGESPSDPEPLSVWGIDSFDERINIIMHVGSFDSLYVDGEPAQKDKYPEVAALLAALSNVAVRDIWITPEER